MAAELNFSMEENPPWREENAMSSSQMLTEITKWIDKLASNPLKYEQKDKLKSRQCCACMRQLKELESKEEKKFLNMTKATEHMHKDMQTTGLLTIQQILDIHKRLLNGLDHRAGELRSTIVYTTTPDGEQYEYMHPFENTLYGIIDHNEHMESIKLLNNSIYEKLEFLVRCAAWLLFNFVHTHLFPNGNGRMCRLLAAYTMMVLVPFPVNPYQIEHGLKPVKLDYVEAIVSCQRDKEQHPSLIGALIVDGLYHALHMHVNLLSTS